MIPANIPTSARFLPHNEAEIWFLTVFGVANIVKLEEWKARLPDVSEDEIASKSKADWPMKSFVCVQTLWFMSQCITRRMFQTTDLFYGFTLSSSS